MLSWNSLEKLGYASLSSPSSWIKHEKNETANTICIFQNSDKSSSFPWWIEKKPTEACHLNNVKQINLTVSNIDGQTKLSAERTLAGVPMNGAFNVVLCNWMLSSACLWHLLTRSSRRIEPFIWTKQKQNYSSINEWAFTSPRLIRMFAYRIQIHAKCVDVKFFGDEKWPLWEMRHRTERVRRMEAHTICLMESFLLLKSVMHFSEISLNFRDSNTMTRCCGEIWDTIEDKGEMERTPRGPSMLTKCSLFARLITAFVSIFILIYL